jgi:putative transposase
MPAIGMSLTNQAGTCGKDDIILCPLDQTHFWEALRYTELNPLRARLVSEPELWPWSSAAVHCGTNEHDAFLALDAWRPHWTVTTWRQYLGEIESKLAVIRQRTHTGCPLGPAEFIQDLEKATQRQLALQKRGPREKIVTDQRQRQLTFNP